MEEKDDQRRLRGPADETPRPLDEPQEEKTSGSLFYRRVESSPCLQHAFKTSILLGISASLLAFLKTTSVLKASYWAWGTYFVSQYPLWFLCRYNERRREEITEHQEKMMFSRVMLEGTQYEKELDKMLEQKEKETSLHEVSNNQRTKDDENSDSKNSGGGS